jgi:nitrate/TMAO reductase-like tetraheme cytochrome c subunit
MTNRRSVEIPPPPRALRGHLVLGGLVVVAAAGAYLLYRNAIARDPSRGYTPLGLWFGGVGTALFLGVVAYALRKRAGQEWRWLPGRLQTWLRVHTWMSALGLVLVLLHAGLHLDGRPGTWAVGLLAATLLSGVVGGWFYLRVPGAVVRGPGNLATRAAQERVRALEEQMEDAVAGRSHALVTEVAHELGRPASDASGPETPDDREILERVRGLAKARRDERLHIAQQERLRGLLRGWLWVHVPLAVLFLLAVPWHVYDALELRWTHRDAGPTDYADPATCAECHPNQYREWLVSSHVTAQSSPIMDLQYRALLAKERRETGGAPVATLCVTCHAPLGNVARDPDLREPVDLAVEARAPASRTGVSCATCHQIDAVHAGDPKRDPDGLSYVNMANLSWTEGRTMFGQLGSDGDPAIPSVGNAAHQGVFGAHLLGSEFCASCHTVRVEKPPQGERRTPVRVTLQNTYEEWRTKFVRQEQARGFDEPEALQCMNCHSMDLSSVAELARSLGRERKPLGERSERLLAAIRGLTVAPGRLRAAEPADGFDLPLPPRRRFLHTFVGVDLHTEDEQPLLAEAGETSDARAARLRLNRTLHEEREHLTANLLAVAAGVRVASLGADGVLRLEVANLATGHHLPAGFAFAREFWLEVSAARAGTDTSDDAAWTRWVGGTSDGGALPVHQRLPREDSNIHNLQAVLFDDDALPGPAGVETVLQTEVTKVLTGEEARARGFRDRAGFLLPGQVRSETLRLDPARVRASIRAGDRLRVRMLFRNLPVEFLERLAERYEFRGSTEEDRRQAARARGIIQRLRILVVAEDVVDVSKVAR